MKYLNKALSMSRGTMVLTVVALVAMCGSVYAANGHVFGVKSLPSSTVTPPTALAVSSTVSHSTIFRSHNPKCTTFTYTTNKGSRNTISINGMRAGVGMWQAAGSYAKRWCGNGPGPHKALGFYNIRVSSHTATENKSSMRTVRIKR